jgi:ATP-dependent helicase/nuclease subunit A
VRNRPARPLQAGDIMVLVRQRSPFVTFLVRALKRLNIPVAGIDRMVLTDHIAIKDLLALGRFLLLPEDDYNLACLLKSPLLALDIDYAENILLELCPKRGGTLWQELQNRGKADAKIKAIAEHLFTLLARADQIPPYELYQEILSVRQGRQNLVQRLGEECLDPIEEFLNLCLEFAKSNSTSLQEFIDWISADEIEIKRDLEQGARDEVRIMTVHGAKGLQAPIVFLPDTTSKPKNKSDILFLKSKALPIWVPHSGLSHSITDEIEEEAKQKTEEEYRRLLYVALTRAEDRLYVCGSGDTVQKDSWYDFPPNHPRRQLPRQCATG